MKNLVTTKWLGGMAFESDNPSGHTIKIDVDAENGGENSG
ncbi:MAG TPA: osmotically inducible protein OsmC, partial [Flavobacteriaceae bacterium]|nr:osmotically inducible protein OsmC [Flavobacteriaceae bacterium]